MLAQKTAVHLVVVDENCNDEGDRSLISTGILCSARSKMISYASEPLVPESDHDRQVNGTVALVMDTINLERTHGPPLMAA